MVSVSTKLRHRSGEDNKLDKHTSRGPSVVLERLPPTTDIRTAATWVGALDDHAPAQVIGWIDRAVAEGVLADA